MGCSARRREASADAGVPERQVGGRTFRLESEVWTDVRPAGTRKEVVVKAYSKAYFDLLGRLPELAPIVGLGEQVTAVGRGVVISIRTAGGSETLSDAQIRQIVQEW